MRHALLNNSTDQIEFTASTTDDDRWASVVARDRESDSKFVYSVSTTAIYCRPSCPARLAQRVGRIDRQQLATLGEVHTPSIADLFVAVIGNQAGMAQGVAK